LPSESNSIYWWDTESVTPGEPLAGTERADVCIVGGGYTGLWAAYFLKQAEPTPDVVVVERSWAGSGASGHNDGYAMTVLDMSAGYRWRFLDVGLTLDNVLGLRWREGEYHFASHWDPARPRSEIPTIHYVAGYPFGVRLTLSAFF